MQPSRKRHGGKLDKKIRSFSFPHLLSSFITSSSLQEISGDYCECDNYSCDRYNGELCSGPDHGECVCGKCKCNSEWEVEGYSACECRASNESCITPFGEHIMKVCSGHGECVCGACRCEEGFSGRWCEGVGGHWVWSDLNQTWEWVQKTEVNRTEVSVQDSTGWIRASDGTFVRRTSSWSSWTSTSSRSRSRSSSSALDPSDVVETSRANHNQGLRSDPGSTTHCEDYEELSPHCNNVGTYNCGVCQCTPDFFGINCECSVEALPFNMDLEAGCRCAKFFAVVHEGNAFQYRPAVFMSIS